MAWNYSGDPSKSLKDEVRFLVGDTDCDDQQLLDEEIDYLVTREGSALKAAAEAALSLKAKFCRCADEAVGQVRISFSQKAKQYGELSAQLLKKANMLIEVPFAGGIRDSDKRSRDIDGDRTPEAFKRDTHDNPRVGGVSDDRSLKGC